MTPPTNPLAALREAKRDQLAGIFREWIHGQSGLTQCNPSVDTCPDWPLAYELADLALKATEPLIAENEELRRERDELRTLIGAERAQADRWQGTLQEKAESTRSTSEALAGALEEAGEAISRTITTLIAIAPKLEEPYPDDPRWSPWTRFIDRGEGSLTPWPMLKAAQSTLRSALDSARTPTEENPNGCD